LYRQTALENPNKNRTNFKKGGVFFDERNTEGPFLKEKKTARTSQKEEEVGELPRATEVTGGRRSLQISKTAVNKTTGLRSYSHVISYNAKYNRNRHV
jgi:hypothetical protein